MNSKKTLDSLGSNQYWAIKGHEANSSDKNLFQRQADFASRRTFSF